MTGGTLGATVQGIGHVRRLHLVRYIMPGGYIDKTADGTILASEIAGELTGVAVEIVADVTGYWPYRHLLRTVDDRGEHRHYLAEIERGAL